jgi:hypothetical protein
MVFFTDLNSLLILVAVVGAAIALTVGVYYVVNEKKFSQLLAWSDVVVRSVEQKMKLLEGSKKMELAMLAMRAARDGLKSKATDEDLRNIIEAAVFTMKNVAAQLPGEADDKLVDALTQGLPGNED